ncbi:hypothetical protein BGW41_003557 [Actinomortierella wolfii]|nr:hypothetical protein BGW41_003557 [Actinomortierella wolfii]
MSAPPSNSPNSATPTPNESSCPQRSAVSGTSSSGRRGTSDSPNRRPGFGSVRSKFESSSSTATPAAGATSIATANQFQRDTSYTASNASARATPVVAMPPASTSACGSALAEEPDVQQLVTPPGDEILSATHIVVEHIHGGTVKTHVFASNDNQPAPLHDSVLGRSSRPLGIPLSTTHISADGAAIQQHADNHDLIEAVRASHQETLQAFKDFHDTALATREIQGATEVSLATTTAIDRQLREGLWPKLDNIVQLLQSTNVTCPPLPSSSGGSILSQPKAGSDTQASGIFGGEGTTRGPSSSTVATLGEDTSCAGSDVAQLGNGASCTRNIGEGPSGSVSGSAPSNVTDNNQGEPTPVLERISKIETLLYDVHKTVVQGEFLDDPNQTLGPIDPHATPRIEALRAELLGAPDHFQVTNAKLESIVQALESMPMQHDECLKSQEGRFMFDRAFVNKFLALSMMLMFQAKHIRKNLSSLVDAVNGTGEVGDSGNTNDGLTFTITRGLESIETQIKDLYRVIDIPSIEALQSMADNRDKALTEGIDVIASMTQTTQRSIEGLQMTFAQVQSNLVDLMDKMTQSSGLPLHALCPCPCNSTCTNPRNDPVDAPLSPLPCDTLAGVGESIEGGESLPVPPPRETPRQRQERLMRERAEAEAKRAAETATTDAPGVKPVHLSDSPTISGQGGASSATQADSPSATAEPDSNRVATPSATPGSTSTSISPPLPSCPSISCPDLQNNIQALSESMNRMIALMQEVGNDIRGGQNSLYGTLLQQAEKIIHIIKPPVVPESEAEAAIRLIREQEEARLRALQEKEEKESAEAAARAKAAAKEQHHQAQAAGLQQVNLIHEMMGAFTTTASAQGDRVEEVLKATMEQSSSMQQQMAAIQTSLTDANGHKTEQLGKIDMGVERVLSLQQSQHEAMMDQAKEILSTANDVYDVVAECKRISEDQATQQLAIVAILEEWKRLHAEVAAADEAGSKASTTSTAPSVDAGGCGGGAAPQEGRVPSCDQARAIELLRMIEAYLRAYDNSADVGPAGSAMLSAAAPPLSPYLTPGDESRSHGGTRGTQPLSTGTSASIDSLKDVGAERSPTGGISTSPIEGEEFSLATGAADRILYGPCHEQFVAELADLARRYNAWIQAEAEAAATGVKQRTTSPTEPANRMSSSTFADDAPKVSRQTLESLRRLLPLDEYEQNAALLEEAKHENERLVKSMATMESEAKKRDDTIKQLEEKSAKVEYEYQNYRQEVSQKISTIESRLTEEKQSSDAEIAKQKQKARTAKETLQQYLRGIVPPETKSNSEDVEGSTASSWAPLQTGQLMREAAEQLSQTLEELKEQRLILQREIATLQEEKSHLLTSNSKLERCPCIYHQQCQHPFPLLPGAHHFSSDLYDMSQSNPHAVNVSTYNNQESGVTENTEPLAEDSDPKVETGNALSPSPSLSLLLPQLIAHVKVNCEGMERTLIDHVAPLAIDLERHTISSDPESADAYWGFRCTVQIRAPKSS